MKIKLILFSLIFILGFSSCRHKSSSFLIKQDAWVAFEKVEGLTPGESKFSDAKETVDGDWASQNVPIKLGGKVYEEVHYTHASGITLVADKSPFDGNPTIQKIILECPYDGISESGLKLGSKQELVLQRISNFNVNLKTDHLLEVSDKKSLYGMIFHSKDGRIDKIEFFKR